MRNLFWLIAICCCISGVSAQPACDDQMILGTVGSWKKRPDVLMRAGSPAQASATMEAIGALFKTAYAEPRGMEASWYKSMRGDPIIKNGPACYEVNSLYQAWYCNRNFHKLMLGDETGTWAYVFLNEFSWFISRQYDVLKIQVNGEDVYFLPPIKGEWKGYPLYQASSHGDKGSCIVLTHNNQVPWKPITQEQYLKAVRSYMEQQQRSENNPKSAKRWSDKFGLIDAWLNGHGDQLQQPAIIENGVQNEFTGAFSSLDKGGQMLITVDSAYFNKDLPRYAAQFIVLYWRWDKNAAGLNFKKEFEANFPVEKLKSLLDK